MLIRRIFKVFLPLVFIYLLHGILEKNQGSKTLQNFRENFSDPTSLYRDYKYILAWNDGGDPVLSHWEMVETLCPESRCFLTNNRSYLGNYY